jgi:hypothetical protein
MKHDEKYTFDHGKKFDVQLAQGRVIERRVADMFSRGLLEKIEVKSERWLWEQTGNICIEYANDGKGSGITTTEANAWVHALCDPDGEPRLYLLIPIERLRKLVTEARLAGRVRDGGDGNKSKLALIRIADLLR